MSDYGRQVGNESMEIIRKGLASAAWNQSIWQELRQNMVTSLLNDLANAKSDAELRVVQGKWLAVLTLDAILQERIDSAELERERVRKQSG